MSNVWDDFYALQEKHKIVCFMSISPVDVRSAYESSPYEGTLCNVSDDEIFDALRYVADKADLSADWNHLAQWAVDVILEEQGDQPCL
jgi:hypothetical protein